MNHERGVPCLALLAAACGGKERLDMFPTTEVSLPIPTGTHSLSWRYTKDSSIAEYSGAVWIDNVRADGAP